MLHSAFDLYGGQTGAKEKESPAQVVPDHETTFNQAMEIIKTVGTNLVTNFRVFIEELQAQESLSKPDSSDTTDQVD